MYHIFRPLRRKGVLVFFDDILLYSKCLRDHEQLLEAVFQVVEQHSLYAKMSKCYLGKSKVEYLGHFISREEVETNPQKIEAIRTWPPPTNIKQLRSFLGLARYYRRFKHYALISKPLTSLLKKGAFQWDETAQEAFQ